MKEVMKLFICIACTMLFFVSSLNAEIVSEEWVMRYGNGVGNACGIVCINY